MTRVVVLRAPAHVIEGNCSQSERRLFKGVKQAAQDILDRVSTFVLLPNTVDRDTLQKEWDIQVIQL
ncbi:hypothetical protein QE320_gp128 [Pseudomonas phage EM]|uniref:Uncharacterized protein n=1 Tax=Pseudomonas phage EM TaxID=2936914 RepID=A0AAE9HJJ7_9CAUD|nr:hypothetical protein QE320_gp128 [Pseudomonas phage EM]UPW35926.1 hypothetical protein EM_141 [Pseudomonas phage EM]